MPPSRPLCGSSPGVNSGATFAPAGETFDCLSYTVEMPFKDDANHPDERAGWSPERSMHLGHSALDSVVVCLDTLRGEIPLDLEDTQENLEADFDA